MAIGNSIVEVIFSFLSIGQLLVFVTFLNVLVFADRSKKEHRFLIFILTVSTAIEVISNYFEFYNIGIGMLYSTGAFLHNSLWLLLLWHFFAKGHMGAFIVLPYLLFAVCNMAFAEGTTRFNSYTFIVGALTYILMFLLMNYALLKKEDLSFFLSNNYLLLFAPFFFFIGLSFIFAFKSVELSKQVVFNSFRLYDFINLYVNIIYYGVLNIYVFREKYIKYAD